MLAAGDYSTDRETLQLVLKVVLAQRRTEREQFDRIFSAFVRAHGPPGPQRRTRPHAAAGSEDAHGGSARATSHAATRPARKPQETSEGRTPPLNAAPDELQAWAQREFRRRAEEFEHLDFGRPRPSALDAEMRDDRGVRPVRRTPAAGSPEGPARVAGARAGADSRRPGLPRHGELSAIAENSPEEAQMLGALRRLASTLYLRRSRRTRRYKRGRVDLKATLARSFRTDATPFHIARRRRRLKRARLLLLLDVSGSMRRVARFVLALAAGMRQAFRTVGVFAFVDHPIEVTRDLPADLSLESLPGINWMSQSDYGNTFFKLLSEHDRTLRKDVLLVVMGDARNNFADPMPWTVAEVRGRVGWLLWLDPEPRSRWNTGDSVLKIYAPWCDRVFRCSSLADLEQAAEALVHRASRWK